MKVATAGQSFIMEIINQRPAEQGRGGGNHGPDQMGRTHLCTNQRQRSGGPKCPIVASASLTHAAHSRLALVLPSCRLLLLLRAGGLAHVGSCWRRWYRYFGLAISQGLLAQIHFWAVHDGSDGVPRRVNLAEPVPWTQAGPWPLMSPLGGPFLPSRCLSLPPMAAPPQSCRLPGAGRDQLCSVSRTHPCLPSPMGTRALSVCGCVRPVQVGLDIWQYRHILIPSFASLSLRLCVSLSASARGGKQRRNKTKHNNQDISSRLTTTPDRPPSPVDRFSAPHITHEQCTRALYLLPKLS